MSRFKLVAICLLITAAAHAQLSETATISVLTCGPGADELYAAFGHSAFHVKDSVTGIDIVCDYGAFDFDQPNFYWNFTQGYLNYKFIVEEYDFFKEAYKSENRYVHESYLDLTSDQKQKIYAYLQKNSLPENRTYRYDYFYNNCSTKIRDVLTHAAGDNLRFSIPHEVADESTFRSLTDKYLKNHPWSDLGIDIGLGIPMDKKTDVMEYMFLPPYLEKGLDSATINVNGPNRKLVAYKKIWFDPSNEAPEGINVPRVALWLVFVLGVIITAYDFMRKKISTWFDIILFAITGLVGVLLLFLWLGTDHKAVAPNLNLLWAMPVNLFIVILLKKPWTWITYYFCFITLLNATLLVLWNFLPQSLNTSLVPLITILLIRATVQVYSRIQTAMKNERVISPIPYP